VRVAKGSGRSERDVAELIERFGFMRQMMGNLGQSTGLLSKLPGMKQLSNIKRMKDAMRNMGGGMPGGFPGMGGGMPGGFPGMGGGGFPGLPPGMGGLPGMEGMGDPNQLLSSLMGGGGPFGAPGPGARKKVDKEKKKNLRKMQKKSRKKGR
jgi:signal recognition particle subunit SRP54